MEFVFESQERCGGSLMASRASVQRGKVVQATPALSWAVGQGLHVLLSHFARRKVAWKKRRGRAHPGQMELAL
jgi:hypothetical protein